jgi:uncharacterized membrane protein
VVEGKGRPLTPGLFAGATGLGVEEVSQEATTVDKGYAPAKRVPADSVPFRPEFDVMRAFNPASVLIPVTREEGYTFALLSAIGYGLSPILVRVGLEGKGLGVSLAGGLVAYIAATAAMAMVLLWPGNLRNALAIDRESAKWFTLSGVVVFFSQMFLYMAMAIAPVTVVCR